MPGLTSVEEVKQALIYLKRREDELTITYNALFKAFKETTLGELCFQKLKDELKDVLDAIFILEKYESIIKARKNSQDAPISGPGDVAGHKKQRDEHFDRDKDDRNKVS